MQNAISGLSCNAKVWSLGAVVGVVFFLILLIFGVGAFAAFLLGFVLCVVIGIAGRGMYCGGGSAVASHAEQPMPEAGPAPVPVPGPEPAVDPMPERPVTPAAERVAPSTAAPEGARPTEEAPASAAAATPEAQAEASENPGSKPETLSAPRGGQADDLKVLKGLGPKLEEALNGAGIYHLDQIAAWSADEVVWIEGNIDGVRGRVTRDDWVEQARALSATPQG